MRVLFAALALAAAGAPAAGSAVGRVGHEAADAVQASARADPRVRAGRSADRWFAPGSAAAKACNAVHVFTPSNGLLFVLPTQNGSARNVTCRWLVRGPTVQLALAWRSSNVLWTLRERSPLPFDYVVGAGLTDKKERRFQEIAHARLGEGLWLGGIAGDSSTLVYAVTSVAYVDEVACLAGTGTCRKTVGGGGIYRLVGRRRPQLVPGTLGRRRGGDRRRRGRVRAGGVGRRERPPGLQGRQADPRGRCDHGEAAVRRQPTRRTRGGGARVERGGHARADAEGPADRVLRPEQRRSQLVGASAVGHVARAERQQPAGRLPLGPHIRGIDVQTHRMHVLARAAADPIGLSLDGSRLAWAENVNGSGRIRALYLAGRG